jgi:methyl-accepting chemotaxis protein
MLDIIWLPLAAALVGAALCCAVLIGLLGRRHGSELAAAQEALRAAQADAAELQLLRETDAAARRTTDRELQSERARARRLEQALEHSATHVLVLDELLQPVFANRRFDQLAQQLGIASSPAEPGAARRRDLAALDPGGRLEQALRARAVDASGRRPSQTVDLAVGENRIRVVATPIEDEQGRHAGDLLLWVDKTEENRIERSIAEVLDAVAQGDLTRRIPAAGQEDFLGAVTTGINEIVARLAGLVAAVSESTVAVRGEATGMADRSAQVAVRVETAAASLERTSSSLQQISQAVRQTAGSATTASEIAARTRTEASEGLALVSATTESMQSIDQASREVADIVEVVESIALQIHLLAINAAVEAAHAGEQGRGFAIVADAVRALAARAKAAANDISERVRNTRERVTEGSRLVSQSGQTLERVVGSFSHVAELMEQVALSTRQQSSGIDHVNEAVAQLDQLTRDMSGFADESRLASGQMVTQTDELAEFMRRYRTAGADGASDSDRAGESRADRLLQQARVGLRQR